MTGAGLGDVVPKDYETMSTQGTPGPNVLRVLAAVIVGACAEPGLLRPQQLDCMRLVRLAAAADRAPRAQLVALAQSLASKLGVAQPRRLVRQPQQRSAQPQADGSGPV